MATILLARHGETDWNAERRWQGHSDRPLNERGWAQARALAERLDATRLEAVYSSDLRRARDTATAVADRQGVELRMMPELREVDVGTWAGLTKADVEREHPEAFARWRAGYAAWEDGETYEEMSERVVPAVLRIAETHPDAPVLVVSHGGCIRAIHAAALGLDVPKDQRLRPVEPHARLPAGGGRGGAPEELCAGGQVGGGA